MRTLKVFLFAIIEFLAGKLRLIQFEGEPENITITVNDTKFTVAKTDFAKAVESGSIAIKDENLLLFTKTDHETRTQNLEKEHYGKGKTASLEMKAKELKKKLQMEDMDGKDIDAIVEEYTKRQIASAQIPESEKVKEHEKTIAQLRENLTKAEKEKAALLEEKDIIKSDYTKKEQQLLINNSLNLLVPEKAVTETMNRNDIIALFRANGYDAIIKDDKIVPTKGGEVVKNTVTLEPMKLQDVLLQFVNKKKLIPQGAGRGAGDEANNAAAGTWDAFVKEMEEKGIKIGSVKFQEEQNKRIKNKTLKI
jgi:hypothetical protein